MTKNILLICLLCSSATAFTQDRFWNEKANIISAYEQMQANDTTFQIETIDGDSLFTVVISGTDSLRIEHFFQPYTNGNVGDESLCDSLSITLFCSECFETHLRKLIRSKERKWYKLSDSCYVSQKTVSKFFPADRSPGTYRFPVMEIRTANHATTIILYAKIMTKKEWKALKSVVTS